MSASTSANQFQNGAGPSNGGGGGGGEGGAGNDALGGKPVKAKKKLPACDACKFRRVLCHPALAPGSCPRCAEKKIVCTTTPVVRKRPTGRTGKRIEEAKATFGTTESKKTQNRKQPSSPQVDEGLSPASQSSYQTARISTNGVHVANGGEVPFAPLPPQQGQMISRFDHDSLLGLSQLSGNLAAHLLELFQHTPDAFFPLPLLARNRLCAQFESVGRKLDCLPPECEVLANVIMALTSRLSSHPLIVGPGIPAPDYSTLNSFPLSFLIELREFGRRRQSMCVQFRDNAARMIWDRGVTVVVGEENAASLHLMDVLHMCEGMPSSRPYGAAFASNITAMANDVDEAGLPKLSSGGVHWSPFLMQEALAAESQSRSSFFTFYDQLNMCGETPSVEQPLTETVQGIDIRDVMRLFHLPMQAFTHGVCNLARDASEQLIGMFPRRQPINEHAFTTWLSSFDNLQSLLSLLLSRISDQLAPPAIIAFNNPPATEQERAFVLHVCRYTLPIAWASAILPVYRELERRIRNSQPGSDEASIRKAERLEALFLQTKRATIRAASIVAKSLHDIPTLGHLTHLHFLQLDGWATFVEELKVIENGGEGLSRVDKLRDLGLFIGALKRATFCWSHHCDLLDRLELSHQNLQLENLLQGFSPPVLPQFPGSNPSLNLGMNLKMPPPRPSSSSVAGASPAFNPFPGSPFSEVVSTPEDSAGAYAGPSGINYGAGVGATGGLDYSNAGQRIAGWGPDSPGWPSSLSGGTSGGNAQGVQSHSTRNWS